MKAINKIFILLSSIVLLGVMLASCTNDEETVFKESAAERLDGISQEYLNTLESAPNGWEMHYYTGKDYTGGGYTMLVKFVNGKAQVSADFAPSDSVAVSSYDVIKDQGPVLTFNTYNEILHKMANPSVSSLEGEQADYEFVILGVSNDTIKLKGRKFGNYMEMVKNPDNMNWQEHLSEIQKMDKEMGLTFYNGTTIENSTESLVFDSEMRSVKVKADGHTTSMPYYVTPEGVHLCHRVNMDGTQIQNLIYHEENRTLSDSHSGTTFNLIRPDYYMSYDEFAGNWILVDYYGQHNVRLEPNEERTGFTMTGMSKMITPFLHYNRPEGTIEWLTQYACSLNTGFVYMCAWNADTGSLSLDTKVGLVGKRDLTSDFALSVSFEPNENDYGLKANSFVLYEFDNSGQPVGASSLVFGSSYAVPYVKQLVKY